MTDRESTRIYVPGAYDLFHPGHVNLLKQAKRRADLVIAGVNTDEHIAEYKGRPPILTLKERRTMLLACRYVDEVVINEGGADSKPAILKARANIILHGDDVDELSYLKQLGVTQGWLAEQKISLIFVPYQPGVSSSEVEQRILARIQPFT